MRAREWWRAGVARSVLMGCVVALAALSVPASPLSVDGAQAGADANEAALEPVAPSRQISAGSRHTCMILANGAVRCWGDNERGQLGYGNTTRIGDNERPDSVPPVFLGNGRTATNIAAGGVHTCAILDNGTVKCWGLNSFGQLGYGSEITIGDDEAPGSVGPVNLGAGRTARAITAGKFHTCAILDIGTVHCWGHGRVGVLGYGGRTIFGPPPDIGDDEVPASVGPVNLGAGRTARAITAGSTHTCAILDNGAVRCWGLGENGQLGIGDRRTIGDDELPGSVAPANLGAGRTARAIAAGGDHTCAILDNFTVRCWGLNSFGELGYGNRTRIGDDELPGSVGPVNLGAGRTARAITAGGDFPGLTCAILDNSQVRCWGAGGEGQLGYGNRRDIGDNELPGSVGPVNIGSGRTAVALTVGTLHTCARLDDRTVRCWGEGGGGQLGYGNTNRIGDNETPASAGPVPVGNQPSASASVAADQSSVSVGAGIDYHVTVANTGALALSGVSVSVPAATGCEQPVPDLGIGEEHTIDCSYVTTGADVGTYAATATVDTDQTVPVASTPVEVAVTDDASPAVAVRVTADREVVESGGDIAYQVAVANRGNVDLTGVVVSDPVAIDCEQPVPDLGVGERFTIDCVRTTGADDIGTLTNVATVDTDQTDPVDSAGVDVGVTPAFQPDLAVRKAGGVAIGNNVYNADGAGQTRTSRQAPGGTATFYVAVTNDGQGADTFRIRPVGPHPGLRVRYFQERFDREITAEMVAGTYRTGELNPGSTTRIRVEVTVEPTAARGTTPAVALRALSNSTPAKKDTIKAAVQIL